MVSLGDLFPRQVNCQRAVQLSVSADEAWAVVGDIGANVIGAGMIERVEVTGSGTGAVRVFHLPGGATVSERIEEYDPKNRYYIYRIVDSGPPRCRCR